MFYPFEPSKANSYCLKLISALNNGNVFFKQITKESDSRKNQGVMIGCLVCRDKNGNEKILYALSGISKELSLVSSFLQEDFVFVPPIVDAKKINEALFKNDDLIHELTDKINELKKSKIPNDEKSNATLKELVENRRKLTDESLLNVFSLYEFTRFDGKNISLNQIIQKHGNKLPPTGTGDCCAPKLLSYAFKNELIPLSMDEIYFGPDTSTKKNGNSYAPCDERCGFILPEILGLEIIYRDENIIVVNKQSGLLSVPGRGEDKQDCIVSRVKRLFPDCINQPSVHRLDMETSGAMVLAFTEQAHKELNRAFENRLVQKKYEAYLDGILEKSDGMLSPKKGEKSGEIKLKFRLDVDNRPHQIYDEVYGKEGITLWQNCGVVIYKNPCTNQSKKVTKVIYTPLTGRTHQLRLVSSDIHGFNLPIIGDTLYGHCDKGQRLMLHAFYLSFNHPITGELMEFTVPFSDSSL